MTTINDVSSFPDFLTPLSHKSPFLTNMCHLFLIGIVENVKGRQVFLCNSKGIPSKMSTGVRYRKVTSTSPSCLEANAGFFRLSMKRKFDGYLL